MSHTKIIGGIFGITFVVLFIIVLMPMILVAWNLYLVYALMDIDVPEWVVYLVAMIEYIAFWVCASVLVERE